MTSGELRKSRCSGLPGPGHRQWMAIELRSAGGGRPRLPEARMRGCGGELSAMQRLLSLPRAHPLTALRRSADVRACRRLHFADAAFAAGQTQSTNGGKRREGDAQQNNRLKVCRATEITSMSDQVNKAAIHLHGRNSLPDMACQAYVSSFDGFFEAASARALARVSATRTNSTLATRQSWYSRSGMPRHSGYGGGPCSSTAARASAWSSWKPYDSSRCQDIEKRPQVSMQY